MHDVIPGDLGGYYGLCLGGSAISIFEILDLVIYNFMIKLSMRMASRTAHEKPALRTSDRSREFQVDSPSVQSTAKPKRRWRPSYAATTDNLFML